MSTRINTNVTAFEAARNMSLNSDKLSKNIERLSSGLRINSAADDPAGLVISENMQAQITGLTQATSNSNDAVNMIKTAEGALGEVQNLLMSMRQLAVHASNLGVNSTADTQADQTQINSAIQSINRIASTTQFGLKKLLDGSNNSNGTVSAGTASLASGATAGTTILSQGTWSTTGANTLNVTGATQTKFDSSASAATSGSGFQGNLVINGATYTVGTAFVSNPSGNAVTLAGLNSTIASSGYQASITGTGQLELKAIAAGAPPVAATFDATGLNFSTAPGAMTSAPTAFAGSTIVQGTNALANLNGTNNALSATVSGSNTIFGFSNGLQVQVATPATGAASAVYGTINSVAGAVATGSDLEFQIGANGGQTASERVGSVAADQLGQGAAAYTDANGATQTVTTANVKDINVNFFKGAQDAIAVIDKAISDVSTMRANLGAFQTNVLESNVRSLGVAQQNLMTSQSTIRDTNLSSEIVDFTKNQILVQAGTSALAQANSAPQSILKLLQ